MTLRRFSFGSATEVISGATGEQADCGEVGFGFADGYDFGAGSKAGLCEGPFKGIPDEAYTISAVEADFCEIFRSEICVAGEDHMAGIGVIVDWRSVLRRSAPIPDSQCGTGSTAGPGEAAEAQDAGDRVMESTVDGGSAGRIDTVEARVTGYTLANGVENLVLFGTVASGSGNSLDNSITGNSVANTLNGGTGADAMAGGAGNDLCIVDNAGDTIEGNEDDGIDTVSVTATLGQLPDGYTLAANVENLILGGNASLSGYGNELNNRMTGNSANNILEGGEGNNTLDGGVGRDTLRAGSGHDCFIVDNTLDVIEDAGGYDTVEVRINNYTLAGGMEALRLAGTTASAFGNEGDNLLVGSSLANTLRGMEGNDTLDGGAGVDSLIGGAGDDYYIIDNAGDRVFEISNEGVDTVEAQVTGYTLANGVENLVLFGTVASGTGNSLDNFLIGNAANNSLNGGVGNDTLSAAGSNRGLGQRDTLTGGAGNDVFILADENVSFYDDGISSSTGVADFAYITDFNASQDSLVLSGSAEEYSLILGIFLPVWPALREPATMIFSESRVRRMSWLQ